MKTYTEAQNLIYQHLYDSICCSDDSIGNANAFFEEYEKNPDDVIFQLKLKFHLYCHPKDIQQVIEDFEHEFIEE